NLDLIPLAHMQVHDPAHFVGRDKDQVGFDPALVLRVFLRARSQPDRRHHGEQRSPAWCAPDHREPPGCSRMSMWARIMPATSRWEKRANKPAHRIATRPGATTSYGKRASAS